MKKPRKSAIRGNLPSVRAEHGGQHHFGSISVQVDAVYHVPAIHVGRPGQWTREADKIAWTDPVTGLGCIIKRDPRGGHLSGFVGVGPNHPLYGCNWSAVPTALDIEVHGGLSYSAACDESGPPETSICHVDHERERGGDVWWFGFECDQITDLIPASMSNPVADSALVHGVEPVYRDEAYVFGQVTDLAGQLAAIGEGRDKPPRTSPPPPPIGLDPEKTRSRR